MFLSHSIGKFTKNKITVTYFFKIFYNYFIKILIY